jgi:hypothetical protein
MRSAVIEGLKMLAAFDLTFDYVGILPRHLKHVAILGAPAYLTHPRRPPGQPSDRHWRIRAVGLPANGGRRSPECICQTLRSRRRPMRSLVRRGPQPLCRPCALCVRLIKPAFIALILVVLVGAPLESDTSSPQAPHTLSGTSWQPG